MTDTYRRQFKLTTTDEWRLVKVNITRAEETIDRLTNEEEHQFRVTDVIAKAKDKLIELKQQEADLVVKLARIDEGFYDEQLQEERKEATVAAAEKAATARKRAKVDMIKSKFIPPPRPKIIQPPVGGWAITERSMAYDFDRFMRSIEKFPPKLAEKLMKMPNNEGIIFNQIHFYGKRPPRRPYDTVTLQDKRGDKFYVHYDTAAERKTYVKQGYGRNTKEIFVSSTPRPRISTGF